MKITYGRLNLRIKNVYILFLVLVFITDSLFSTFIFGKMEPDEPAPIELDKFIIPLFFILAILNFHNLNSFLRNWTFCISMYLLVLMLESYTKYGSFFIYPHVFSKVLVLYFIPCGYIFFRNQTSKSLDIIAYSIFVGFLLHLLIFQLDTVSVNAFTNTERGFTAYSAYLLVLVLIYFFNKYLSSSKIIYLLLFFSAAFFLAFLNHRSTWVASSVALFINVLLVKKTNFNISVGTILPIILIPIVALFLLFSFLLSVYPEILTALAERFADIGNAEETGTGKWRLEQFEAYMPFIYDNLLIGLRFEGFELPIQFYEESTGLQPWADGTGHHFHSFYVDKLFYFGITGILFFIPLIIYIIRVIVKKPILTFKEIVTVCYIASGIIFGISYNWPTYFYFFIGIAIRYIHQQETENTLIKPINHSEHANNVAKLKSTKMSLR